MANSMVKNKFIIHTLARILIICVCTLPSFSQSRTEKEQQIINYAYQSAFGIDPTPTEKLYKSNSPYANPYDGSFTSNIKYTYNKIPKPPKLNSYQIRKAAFNIAGLQNPMLYPDTIIDLPLCRKMALLIDIEPNTKNEGNLLFYLSHTINNQNKHVKTVQTASAIPFLLNTITQPHTNISEIKRKQTIIREFTNNTPLFTSATNALKKIGKQEHYFLSYFNKAIRDFAEIDRVVAKIKTHVPQIPGVKQVLEPLINRANNNAQILNLSAFHHFSSKLWVLPIIIAAQYGADKEAFKTIFNWASLPITKGLFKLWHRHDPKTIKKIDKEIDNVCKNFTDGIYSKQYNQASNALYAYYAVNSLPSHLSSYKYDFYVINLAQRHLIGLAHYIQGIKDIYVTLRQNSHIAPHLPALAELEALITPSSKHSKEFNELIQLLSTRTFRGKPSLFSNIGRILRAHTLMSTESVQKEFAGIVNAIGEIDTYCALAQKIKLSADKQVRYSFVEFDTESKTPYIQALYLWNPFIPESKVVTNNIQMGGNKPRNIIMNGPNTGGKSTLAKGILLNIILAQTFGITAAQYLKLTPFSNLDCFMNMSDDTANNISGLKAEVKRAKEILNKIEAGKPTDFHFMLLDEIFTATSPDQAEELARDFLELLADMPNVLFMNATHFDGIVQVGQKSPHCRNCHMGAITDPQNKNRIIKYTHKLVEGRSYIKNAAQVAEDSGLTFKRRPPRISPPQTTHPPMPTGINAPVA